MKVLQILPALNSGGVERGTVDFAAELVKRGHQSLVMSSGGALVAQLEAQGSSHITLPVHKKSLSSLLQVKPLRKQFQTLAPDIVHVRSRVPAWLTWLALKKIPVDKRPALVSTFHGLYSTNAYSAIMGCGDQVIAISQCVYDYIVEHYPKVDRKNITIIHRGVDTEQFNQQTAASTDWHQQFFAEHPQCRDKPLLLMPGRLSRWKGQLQFIELIEQLRQAGTECHGLIVGGPTPGKADYQQELVAEVNKRGLSNSLTLLGHRNDMAELYSISSIIYNLSQHAEPFGRTVIEALAMGIPVISYDYGGPAESLRACFPEGLVPLNDLAALAKKTRQVLQSHQPIKLADNFTLSYQAEATLAVYERALAQRRDQQQAQ